MSNIFRDLESLGKSNGKKWSQIWTFMLENCLKLPRKKKVFFFTFFGVLRFSVFFNDLFAPTSRSRMSNIFKDLESLGKSNGKKWSNIWTFFFGSGIKSQRKKKFYFCWFCLGPPSYGIGVTIRIGREMLCLPYAGFFGSVLAFYSIKAAATLTVVDSGSPRLRIKKVDEDKNLRHTRPSIKMYVNLVPDDNW